MKRLRVSPLSLTSIIRPSPPTPPPSPTKSLLSCGNPCILARHHASFTLSCQRTQQNEWLRKGWDYVRNITPLRLELYYENGNVNINKTAELHVWTRNNLTTNKTYLQLTYKLHLCIIEHNITWFDFTESPQQTVAITNRKQKEENTSKNGSAPYGKLPRESLIHGILHWWIP